MAKALPRGVREKNGSYEARAVVNGIRINLYGTDLNELMEEFEKAKENARDTLDYRKTSYLLLLQITIHKRVKQTCEFLFRILDLLSDLCQQPFIE